MDGESRTIPAKPAPLSRWWIAAVVVIGVMAAALAVGGMILSFRAVSAEMTRPFGRWAWLVPIVTDLAVLVFSGVDLLLNRLRMGHWLARAVVYGATLATIAMNYSADNSQAGRVAHIMMPSVWVAFIELMRHVVRRLTGLADGTLREPVPVARWVLAPWRTAKLWRRMVLWQTNSYPKALAQERVRLEAIALLQERHGPFWRWKVGALVRLNLSLGEPVPVQVEQAGSTEPAQPVERAEPEPGTSNPATVPNRTPARVRTEPPARRTGPRPNSSTNVSPLLSRTERVEMIRTWIDNEGGLSAVPLSRIMEQFGCAKSTASGLRAEADPTSDTASSADQDDDADREDAA